MKILIAHNEYYFKGGEDSVVENEIMLLKENGHDVYNYILKNKEKIKNTKDKINTFINVSYSRQSKNDFLRVIKKEKPNIIHVHNFFPLLTPSIYDAAIECSIPVVQTIHNYRLLCPKGTLFRQGQVCEQCIDDSLLNSIKNKCYQNSFWGSFAISKMLYTHKKNDTWNIKINALIVLSEFAHQKLTKSLLKKDKVFIKPNFTADSGLGWEPSKPRYALFVGRISSEKGLDKILDLWHENQNNFPILKIIGTGPLEQAFKEKYKTSTNIEWIGQVNHYDVQTYMSKATFLIFPSVCYEGSPMVIVEALEIGLPVIASKIGSIKNAIIDNKTGFLFEPNNMFELRKIMSKVTKSPLLLEQISINQKKEFQKNHSSKSNYKKLISIYEFAKKNM